MKQVTLEYDIQELREQDIDDYEIVASVNAVSRETEKAVLINVVKWSNQEIWFPRYALRLDDDIIWCKNSLYHEKRSEAGVK